MRKEKRQREENRVRHIGMRLCLAVACLMMVGVLSACGEEMNLTIQDGDEEMYVTTTSGTKVQKILQDAGLTLGENDEVTPEADYKIQLEDTTITIARYAEVTVVVDEETYDVALVGGTVQDALDEAGIELGENDRVDQDPETYLTDGMRIEVFCAYTEELVVTEEIEYETEYESSSSIYEGETQVSQEGVNGEREITYEVTYDPDGKEVSREQISEEVTVEPVNEIVLQGTKKKQTSSSSSGKTTYNGKKIVKTERFYDCDGSGHGYYEYTLEDGTTAYEDF